MTQWPDKPSVNERDAKAAAEVVSALSPRISRVFELYCERLFAKRFSAVRVLGKLPDPIDPDRPVVGFANHSSWYDPLFFLVLSRRLFPHHLAYGPMDAEALKKYGFMRKIGIFGVEKGSARGAARFLQVSRGLLARKGTALWLTPQGEFADVRVRPPKFQSGIAHLARNCNAVLQPFAIELVFWNESRPEALVHFGAPIDTSGTELDNDGWNARLEGVLAGLQDELAVAAMARDPDMFTTFIDGTTGTNYIYDGWRYLKAMLRGKQFDAAHGNNRRSAGTNG